VGEETITFVVSIRNDNKSQANSRLRRKRRLVKKIRKLRIDNLELRELMRKVAQRLAEAEL